MGYVAKKVHDTRNGLSRQRLRSDGTPYWQVVYEDRKTGRPEGVPRERPVRRSQLESLGIDSKFTFDMVQAQCRYLNEQLNLERRVTRHRERVGGVTGGEQLVQCAFLPPVMVADFERKILLRRFAGSENVAKVNRLRSHWKFAQRLIADLKIDPRDYADECFQIYRYFMGKQISLGYVVKILRTLNAWGQFYTRHAGGTGIEPVKMPRGQPRLEIARAHQSKEGFKGVAAPLAPEELNAKADRLSVGNRDWLYLSIWLGHMSISTTWKYYKQKQIVRFKKKIFADPVGGVTPQYQIRPS